MTSEFEEVRRRLFAARGGDLGALDAVIVAYGPHVLQAVRGEMGDALRSRHEAEDLAQDVWTRAIRAIDSFRGDTDAAFRAWLQTMAGNVARDHARRGKARGAGRDVPLDGARDSRGGAPAPGADAVAASGPSPSRVIRRRERSARLEKALDRLSEDHRRVIELVRLEGLPVKDVAARMGRSPNAVSMLLLRALKELKGLFGGTESLTLPRPAGDEEDDASRGEAGGDDRRA